MWEFVCTFTDAIHCMHCYAVLLHALLCSTEALLCGYYEEGKESKYKQPQQEEKSLGQKAGSSSTRMSMQ